MPSFRAKSRNIPRTPLFLASFAKGFPFSTLSCSLRRRIPLPCYHTYDIIPSCKKDPSTSLGMTLRKWRFPNISFIRDVGYPSPIPSFRAQQKIFLALCSFLLLSQKFSPFPLSHIRRYIGVQERSLGFARDDDTGIALSQHILYTMRRISPYDAKEKSPGKSRSFFCVRKTYLPNCASMVPAATAVPITPATFGPIACISR